MVVVDIMAYAKKVPAKKSQIENWRDMQNICGTLLLNLQVIMQV